jgi:hypothetical protein
MIRRAAEEMKEAGKSFNFGRDLLGGRGWCGK